MSFIEVSKDTNIKAMLEVLEHIEMSNNGYIWVMERLSEEAKASLPAMAKAGLVVLTAHKVYSPESYECFAEEGMAGPIVDYIPTTMELI